MKNTESQKDIFENPAFSKYSNNKLLQKLQGNFFRSTLKI